MSGQAVQNPSAPTLAAVAERRLDEGSVIERTTRIGNQQGGMHAHGRSDAGAGGAGTGRIVERELSLMHVAGDQTVLCAAETVVELLRSLGLRPLRFDDVKAQQSIAELQSVLQRSDDLLIDARADHERVDDGFDGCCFVFVEVDVVAQIARLAVDSARR